jgi:hypothetical protein
MLNLDPIQLIDEHRRRLEAEAEQERLIAMLPPAPSPAAAARRGLALACYRLATWLDAPAGYVQMPEAGPEDWVTPWASV